MDWSAIGPLVAQAAPTIGGLLGGLIPFPGGAILGQVAGKIIAAQFGVAPTPEAVHEAITNGEPSAVQAALTEAEAKMQAEVEKFKAQMEDVQDARATQVALVNAGSSMSWGPVVLSVLIILGFIGCLFSLMLVKISFSETSGQAFLILTGILSQAFAQVCGFWLGSSSGSADKSAQIAALAGAAITSKPPIKAVKR